MFTPPKQTGENMISQLAAEDLNKKLEDVAKEEDKFAKFKNAQDLKKELHLQPKSDVKKAVIENASLQPQAVEKSEVESEKK
jgi:hypothetical protein